MVIIYHDSYVRTHAHTHYGVDIDGTFLFLSLPPSSRYINWYFARARTRIFIYMNIGVVGHRKVVNIVRRPSRPGSGCARERLGRTEIMSNAGFPGLGPSVVAPRARVDKHFKGSPLSRPRANRINIYAVPGPLSLYPYLSLDNIWFSESGSPAKSPAHIHIMCVRKKKKEKANRLA